MIEKNVSSTVDNNILKIYCPKLRDYTLLKIINIEEYCISPKALKKFYIYTNLYNDNIKKYNTELILKISYSQ